MQAAPKRQLILISAGLVLLILIAFEPVRHNDFINYDDRGYVTENHHIQSGITRESVVWAFTSGYISNWHPMTWLSHMLDIELFGLNPVGHHLHSLILHSLSTILLFLILQRMTGAVWRSAFVAMAFGIHPLHVESVAWAAERKDVLGALFWMLTVAAYLYYARRGGMGRYLLVILCFALGLMAKPMLVTLPIILLLLDFWPLGRIRSSAQNSKEVSVGSITCNTYRSAPLSRLMIEKLPLFILTLASCIVTYVVQQKGGSVSKLDFFPLAYRIANAFVSYIAYLYKTVWPMNLAVLYPNPLGGWPLWKPIVSCCLLALCSGFVIYNHKKHPYLLTGWFWYVISLVPVIGLVQVGMQAMADRYTYLPSIGIFILLSWAAANVSAKWRHQKILMGTLSGLLALAMVAGTRTQLAYWKDSFTLFEHTLAVTQNNYLMHSYIGLVFGQQGKLDEAISHIKKALQIRPDDSNANTNMAVILIHRKQYDQAMAYLRKALEAEPDSAEANIIMGMLLMEQQRLDEALDYFRKGLKANPDYTKAYYNMGIIFETRKKFDDAIHAYQQVLRLTPGDFTVWNKIGNLKLQQDLLDEAADCFRQSIQIHPNQAEAYRNLGLVLQTQGRLEQAISYYRMALKIEPNNYMACCDLGTSLQMSGKLKEAIVCYRQTLQLKPDFIMAMNNLAWILAATPDNKIQNPAEAIQLAQKACQLTSFENPDTLDTLAIAYAGTNQFKEAIETAQKAIDLASAAGQKDKAQEISKRLQLYQAGKPYYESSSKK